MLLDRATVSGDAVTVPITILSVLNNSDQTQQPQRFEGTYTLRQEAGSWHIASANIDESDAVAEPPASTGDALRVLQAYYQAIDGANYPRAYIVLGKQRSRASQQSYSVFVMALPRPTGSLKMVGQAQINGAAGSVYTEVPVVVLGSSVTAAGSRTAVTTGCAAPMCHRSIRSAGASTARRY